jgi:hypothetical protein
MARSRSRRTATTSRSIVLRPAQSAGPRPIVVRTTRTIKPKVKRRRGGGGGKGERHRIMALGGAAVLALLDKSETLHIPTLPFLGKAGTAGVAAWAFGKYTKNAWADDMATGMLAIAVYELVKEGHIDGEEVEGRRHHHRTHGGGDDFEGGI